MLTRMAVQTVLVRLFLACALALACGGWSSAAVSGTTTSVSYAGSGTTGPFSVPFVFIAPSDLRLQTVSPSGAGKTLTYSTDYSVAGGAIPYSTQPLTGTVTLTAALATGYTLVIDRGNMPPTQPLVLTNGGPVQATALSGAYDRGALIAQQVGSVAARSIQFPAGDGTSPVLPPAANRAGQYLFFDPVTGAPEMSGGSGPGGSYLPLTGGIMTGLITGLGPATYNDNSLTVPTTQWVWGWANIHIFNVYASLISPVFAGVPQAPTPSATDSSTAIATTAFVNNWGATYVTGTFAPLASPALTGAPTAPTAGGGTNTTQLATTAFVQSAISPKAPLASPALTGAPTAPTAAALTANTQIATTAYCDSAVSAATSVVTGYAVFVDQQTSGTGGGTSTIAGYQQRNLNTTVINTLTSSIALGTNTFTLQAGTYRIEITTPGGGVGAHQAQLYNVTDSSVTANGSSEFSGQVSSAAVAVTVSRIVVQITLAGAKTFKVNHYTTAGIANGLGIPDSTGNPETYTRVIITRTS